MTIERLLLVDGDNLFWRSYHGLRPSMAMREGQVEGDGVPTWAVHGAMLSLASVIREYQPSHLVLALDGGPSQHRLALWPSYKEGRASSKSDPEFRLAREMLEKFAHLFQVMGGFTHREMHVEADDVIATCVRRFPPASTGVGDLLRPAEILIVSGDKDMRQLIGEGVTVLEPSHQGVADSRTWTAERVREAYGVDPAFLPDFLALAGDSSDGFPGIKGIGPKKATKIVQRWGSARMAVALDPAFEGNDEARELVRIGMDIIQLRGDIADCGFEGYQMRWRPVRPGEPLSSTIVEVLDELALSKVRSMWLENRLWDGERAEQPEIWAV